MQSKPAVPTIVMNLGWGAALPHRVAVSTTACAELCLLLGALLIVFAVSEMSKVRKIGRRLAASD